MRIWIARHGQVLPPQPSSMGEHGAQLYLGDPPLTALGESQAQALGRHVRALGFNGVMLASPYRRTLSTAQHCAAAAGADQVGELKVFCCPEVREMVGPAGLAPDFKGLSLDQAREVCPLLQADAQLPWPWWTRETESKADLVARLDAAVDAHSHDAEDLLIITHGGPMNAATKAWLERAGEAPPRWLDCWNTQVNRFHRDASGNWHCDALADTAHLSGPEQHSCNELDYNAMRTMREKALQG